MRASVYIEMLQELIAEHGDLEVEKWMPAKGRHEAPAPTLPSVASTPPAAIIQLVA